MFGGGGGIVGGVVVFVVFGGGVLLFQSVLFNVDGGYRVIKYWRISGVSKDIYIEGMLGLDIIFLLQRQIN